MSKKKQNGLTAGLIFVSIIGLFVLIQALSHLYPFGSRSNLLWDEEIQYVDYFAFYRDVLLGKADIGYSFSKSAGGSLVALFGYYLGCPLNLLVVFFKNEQLPIFLFALTAVKLGLSGVTMHIFIRKRFAQLSWGMGVMLSMAYGLMQYSILQLSNIMWLDGVILLPLLLLAVYEFVHKEKKLWLFVMVLFSIAINWYTGYMTGLFSVLYFIYERLLKIQKFQWKECRKFLLDSVRCAFVMICAVLGSCFVFYPVFKGLQKGKQAFDPSIFYLETYDSLIDVFRGFAVGSIIPTVSLYCGLLFLAFFFYYFLCKRVKLWEKCLSLIAVLFMFASCWLLPLDRVWSGMRAVASYRFRYSFIVIFLVLYLAARGAVEYEKQEQNKTMALIFAGCMVMFCLLHYKSPYEKQNFKVTLLFLTVYAVLFLFISMKQKFKLVLPVLLTGELVLNGVFTFVINYGSNQEISVYQDYAEQSAEQVEQIKEQENSLFYRMDTLEKRNDPGDGCSAYLNEAMVYGYRGLAHYSSTYDTNLSRLIFDLGYSTLLDLSVVQESILPADSLFGVKYLLSKYPVQGYEKVDSIAEFNGKSVYYNPYALSLGMEADEDILKKIETADPFEFQNQLYSNLLGREVKIFRKTDASAVIENNVLNLYISADKSEDLLYGYVDSWITDLKLYVDGNYRCNYATWLSYKIFGVGNGSQEHMISLENYTGTEQEMTAYFYYLDQDVFEAVIQELREKEMELKTFEDGYVKGSYQADKDSQILLSVPYDDGWEARVNGEKVEISEGANALSVIPVKKGANEIELQYKVPGVKVGLLLSVAGILMFTVFCWFEKNRKLPPY